MSVERRMFMKIIFMSKEFAEKEIPSNEKCIISISDPDEKVFLKNGWKEKISFKFDDLDPEELKIIGRKDLIRSGSFFDEKQAKDLIEFVMHIPKYIDTVIVHCSKGTSRSAAVANFLCEKLNCMKYNMTGKKINPNQLVEKMLNKVWDGE
jgi:predicted protein tyrosine phosphatase